MSEIFEAKDLQVGDRYGHRHDDPGHYSHRVLYVDEKGLLADTDGYRGYAQFREDWTAITRVERDGVQIFPKPECPFKKGDRMYDREALKSWHAPCVCTHTRFYAGAWEVQVCWPSGGLSGWHPATGFELAQPEERFKKGEWWLWHGVPCQVARDGTTADWPTIKPWGCGPRHGVPPKDLTPYVPPVEELAEAIQGNSGVLDGYRFCRALDPICAAERADKKFIFIRKPEETP